MTSPQNNIDCNDPSIAIKSAIPRDDLCQAIFSIIDEHKTGQISKSEIEPFVAAAKLICSDQSQQAALDKLKILIHDVYAKDEKTENAKDAKKINAKQFVSAVCWHDERDDAKEKFLEELGCEKLYEAFQLVFDALGDHSWFSAQDLFKKAFTSVFPPLTFFYYRLIKNQPWQMIFGDSLLTVCTLVLLDVFTALRIWMVIFFCIKQSYFVSVGVTTFQIVVAALSGPLCVFPTLTMLEIFNKKDKPNWDVLLAAQRACRSEKDFTFKLDVTQISVLVSAFVFLILCVMASLVPFWFAIHKNLAGNITLFTLSSFCFVFPNTLVAMLMIYLVLKLVEGVDDLHSITLLDLSASSNGNSGKLVHNVLHVQQFRTWFKDRNYYKIRALTYSQQLLGPAMAPYCIGLACLALFLLIRIFLGNVYFDATTGHVFALLFVLGLPLMIVMVLAAQFNQELKNHAKHLGNALMNHYLRKSIVHALVSPKEDNKKKEKNQQALHAVVSEEDNKKKEKNQQAPHPELQELNSCTADFQTQLVVRAIDFINGSELGLSLLGVEINFALVTSIASITIPILLSTFSKFITEH